MAAPSTPRDQVDEIVDYWCQENPGLDMTSKGLAVRIRRVAHHLERALRRELAVIDMEMWEFEVLLPLRRSPGRRCSVGELSRDCQVTAGAVTNRVGRLEDRGLVRRDVDPADRRQVIVSLTERGLDRADLMVATKTHAEQRALDGLDRATQERMVSDLRTLLVSLEGDAEDCPSGSRSEPATGTPTA